MMTADQERELAAQVFRAFQRNASSIPAGIAPDHPRPHVAAAIAAVYNNRPLMFDLLRRATVAVLLDDEASADLRAAVMNAPPAGCGILVRSLIAGSDAITAELERLFADAVTTHIERGRV